MGLCNCWTEPLLLAGPSREYHRGDWLTVDGKPAVIQKVLMDTGTVLRAEIKVYESVEARESADA